MLKLFVLGVLTAAPLFGQLVATPNWVSVHTRDLKYGQAVLSLPQPWSYELQRPMPVNLGHIEYSCDASSGVLFVRAWVDKNPDPKVVDKGLVEGGLATPFSSVFGLQSTRSQTILPGLTDGLVITGRLASGQVGVSVLLPPAEAALPSASAFVSLTVDLTSFPGIVRAGFLTDKLLVYCAITNSIGCFEDTDGDLLPDSAVAGFPIKCTNSVATFEEFVTPVKGAVIGLDRGVDKPGAHTVYGLGLDPQGGLRAAYFDGPSLASTQGPGPLRVAFASPLVSGVTRIFVQRFGSLERAQAFTLHVSSDGGVMFVAVPLRTAVWPADVSIVDLALPTALAGGFVYRLRAVDGAGVIQLSDAGVPVDPRPVIDRDHRAQIASGGSLTLTGANLPPASAWKFSFSEKQANGSLQHVVLSATVQSHTPSQVVIQCPAVASRTIMYFHAYTSSVGNPNEIAFSGSVII